MQVQKTLGEIMTRDPRTLRAHDTLLTAMTLLREHRVRHIPIVDDERRLLGIVTDRDVKRATPSAILGGQRAQWEEVVTKTTLDRVMTKEPITGWPIMPFKEALRRFVADRIGCIPVVESGRLVGIVTSHDMFKAVLEALG